MKKETLPDLSARKFVFTSDKKRKWMLLEMPAKANVVFHRLNVTRLSFSPLAERRTRKEQNSTSTRKTVKETRQGNFYRPMKSFGASFMYSFVPSVSFSFLSVSFLLVSFSSCILVPFWWQGQRRDTYSYRSSLSLSCAFLLHLVFLRCFPTCHEVSRYKQKHGQRPPYIFFDSL